MPYVSDKQRRYLHARHPEIAARWDAEIRAQKKKKGKIAKAKRKAFKVGDKVLIPVATGAVATVAANQFPQNQKDVRRTVKDIKKNLVPIEKVWKQNADPEFNHEYAQKVFDLVSKMDDESAQMFAYLVAAEVLEQDIENNQRTLQRHVDDILTQRMGMITKAASQLISKAGEKKLWATELAEFNELHPRGEAGRWIKKLKVEHITNKPFSHRDAVASGIRPSQRRKYSQMTPEQRAHYQQEYLQIADFLKESSYDAIDGKVIATVKDHMGRTARVPMNLGTRVDTSAWDPARENVTEVMVIPQGLVGAGGASLNLAAALAPETLKGRAAETGLPEFARQWSTNGEGDDFLRNSNARLYHRTGAAGKLISGYGEKKNLPAVASAGYLAELVGSHGPEAEKVIGPAARKTAYRYRGTEKAPDPKLVREYEKVIGRTQISPVADQERLKQVRAETNRQIVDYQKEEAKLRSRVAGGRVKRDETARAWADIDYRGIPVPPAEHAQFIENAQKKFPKEGTALRAPKWGEERDAGREVVVGYLRGKLPNKHLYGLNLAAGNTPPSQGVMLDRDGRIIAEAVGYGDDHYLPFNLKHLQGLKGGEYVRTRSVGGPTTEDVYTGLMSGARRVTVVSRSGVFSVEFDPTFRGGRRYNDKALRMTNRYAHLLDAVQSEQVDANPVPQHARDMIEEEVESRYGSRDRYEKRQIVEQKLAEYKAFSGLDQYDREWIDRQVFEQEQEDPRKAAKMRSELTADILTKKEYKFRLNGLGYAAALKSLEEQFPYYITTDPRPLREVGAEPERDKGYVMPAFNRPAAAKAGWWDTRVAGAGTEVTEGKKEATGKFKANEVNYQNFKIMQGRSGRPPFGEGTGSTEERPNQPGQTRVSSRIATPERRSLSANERLREGEAEKNDQAQLVRQLPALFNNVKYGENDRTPEDPIVQAAMAGDRGQLKELMKNRADRDRLVDILNRNRHQLQAANRVAFDQIDIVLNGMDRPAYDGKLSKKPPIFNDQLAYSRAADMATVDDEFKKLDSNEPITTNRKLSEMSEDELVQEFAVTDDLRDRLSTLPTDPLQRTEYLKAIDGVTNAERANELSKLKNGINDHLENVARARALNYLRRRHRIAGGGSSGGGAAGGFAPPTGGSPGGAPESTIPPSFTTGASATLAANPPVRRVASGSLTPRPNARAEGIAQGGEEAILERREKKPAALAFTDYSKASRAVSQVAARAKQRIDQGEDNPELVEILIEAEELVPKLTRKLEFAQNSQGQRYDTRVRAAGLVKDYEKTRS